MRSLSGSDNRQVIFLFIIAKLALVGLEAVDVRSDELFSMQAKAHKAF